MTATLRRVGSDISAAALDVMTDTRKADVNSGLIDLLGTTTTMSSGRVRCSHVANSR
jgi:hypothetical protein